MEQVLDSRDLQKQIDVLTKQRAEYGIDWERAHPYDADELEQLLNVRAEVEKYSSEWKYGAFLIQSKYFTEYCEQMVEDVGDLPSNIPSYIVIDWDATAENLKEDYMEVDFAGYTWLVRID